MMASRESCVLCRLGIRQEITKHMLRQTKWDGRETIIVSILNHNNNYCGE